MKIFKLLAIDGGGIFGIIPGESLSGYSPYAAFDAFTGTSIGAVMAAYYAFDMDPTKLTRLMLDAFPKIFSAPWYSHLNPCGADYPAGELETFLGQVFGTLKLGDCHKPLFIPVSDFANNEPIVYSSLNPAHTGLLVKDILRQTVAAPTFFDPAGNFVDGGLWANNPTMAGASALTKAMNVEDEQVAIFNVGTGHFEPPRTNDMNAVKGYSVLGWATPLINFMLAMSVKAVTYYAKEQQFAQYVRWDKVPLEPEWTMDDASLCPMLQNTAKLYQSDFDAAIDAFMAPMKEGAV